uniref:Uncharacterized protein n=1 Tax=uncultured prokaryote TaxID=198431 RepID=A0A0H5Q8D7_9ZZZZ|nr:hypothetical protein [uncultured prokaryote]
MTTPVYSAQLGGLTGSNLTGLPQLTFTVPAGFLYIVRDVEVGVLSGISTQVHFWWGETLSDDETNVYPMAGIATQVVINGPSFGHWDGRHIFPAGTSCWIQDASAGGLSSFSMAGYILTLP